MANNIRNIIAANMLAEVEAYAERNARHFRTREDPFELPERQFLKLYRLDKRTVDNIVDIVEQYPHPTRSSALDASVQVRICFCTCQYYIFLYSSLLTFV